MHTTISAQAPPDPERRETRHAGAVSGLMGQENVERANDAATGGAAATAGMDAGMDFGAERARVEGIDKRFATLRAKAALIGWQMHISAASTVLMIRWGRSREFTLDEAEAFVQQLGGTNAP